MNKVSCCYDRNIKRKKSADGAPTTCLSQGHLCLEWVFGSRPEGSEELLTGKAGGRGNSTDKPPRQDHTWQFEGRGLVWLELRENREEERDEIRSSKDSSRTVGTHQALEQGRPSSVTGVAFRRMILWSTHPA